MRISLCPKLDTFSQQRQASNLITAKLLLLKICLPLTGLGIVNDLPKFISNLSERTAPLREMLRRYTNWSWEAPYQKAFEPLKLYISNPQSLFLWSCKGCCTWQIPHKEFIEKLKPVETDQKPLTAIVNKPLHIEPACLQRRLLRLLRYNFKFTYEKGTEL